MSKKGLDPDLLAAKRLLQELTSDESNERIATLSPELQQKYQAINKANQMLAEAGVTATIFSHPEGAHSLFQTNTWESTLYKTHTPDGLPDGQDVSAAWKALTRGFVAYIAGPINKSPSEISMDDICMWISFCYQRESDDVE